ncbi:MAG: hypothetical protein M3R48_02775 [Candidatus Dormibacteraeota bacterium]|nr:hypothetical protein [Candidatus Dormibacteraeota bacterium]
MRDAERKAGRQTEIGNPRRADDVKTRAAGDVNLEKMWPACGFEVEEADGSACVLGSSIGGCHCLISAQVEHAEGSGRIPAAPVGAAQRGVERVSPVRTEDAQVCPGPDQ